MKALAIFLFGLLSGCVEEPTPKDVAKAEASLEQDAVKTRQLSIEQAAEEATKLIEADTKQEIDELEAEPVPNSSSKLEQP